MCRNRIAWGRRSEGRTSFRRHDASAARELWEDVRVELEILAVAPAQRDGRADNRADTTKKKSVYVPRNKDVLKLAQKLEKETASGLSENDIALDFAEGNAKHAASLLRGVRRLRANLS